MAAGPRQPACTEGIRLDCDDSRAAELRLGAAVFVSVYLYYHLPPSLHPSIHPSFLPSISLSHTACGPRRPRGPRLVAAADAMCRGGQHRCRARRAGPAQARPSGPNGRGREWDPTRRAQRGTPGPAWQGGGVPSNGRPNRWRPAPRSGGGMLTRLVRAASQR